LTSAVLGPKYSPLFSWPKLLCHRCLQLQVGHREHVKSKISENISSNNEYNSPSTQAKTKKNKADIVGNNAQKNTRAAAARWSRMSVDLAMKGIGHLGRNQGQILSHTLFFSPLELQPPSVLPIPSPSSPGFNPTYILPILQRYFVLCPTCSFLNLFPLCVCPSLPSAWGFFVEVA
jgi:hypothetical protein